MPGRRIRQLSRDDPRTALCQFRPAAGPEEDVPLEKADGSVAGVEVTASATVAAADFAALQELRDLLGKKSKKSIDVPRASVITTP